MEQQLNSITGFWANDDKRDKEDFEQLSHHDAKLPVMRSLPSNELLNRINQYREQLSESNTVTDNEFRMMAKAIYGVKLIIADMLKGNDA